MKSIMIISLKIIALLIIIYTAIMIYMYLFQRHYAFQPSVQNPFDGDYRPFNTFKYKTPLGLTLRGLMMPAQPGKQTIIYFQGNAGHIGNRLYKTKYFLPHGYGFVLVGYRGYSGNPGMPSEWGLYEDARAAIAFVKGQGVSDTDIILYGESLGTGVAVQMATEFPDIKALILEAPYTSLVDVGERNYWYLPVPYLMKDRFDNISKIGHLRMPILIIHGTKDQVIDYSFGRRLYESVTSKEKEFATIDGAGHADLYDYKAGEAINDFLEKL